MAGTVLAGASSVWVKHRGFHGCRGIRSPGLRFVVQRRLESAAFMNL